MTVNFYLDKPNLDAETAIYLFARLEKQTIKVKTGDYIHPAFWNTKPNRQGHHVKGTFTGSAELNYDLGELKGKVIRAFKSRLDVNPAFRFLDLKGDILALLQPTEPLTVKTLMEHFDDYIAVNAAHRSESTLRKYKGIQNHLRNFSEEKRYPLTFEGINLRFYDELLAYLITDLNHTENTVWKTFATLKAFLSWALDRGYHQNPTFKKFKVQQRDVDITYLTEEELTMLYEYDLSGNPRLARIRDVFCFACYTGQRYSDLEQLKHSDVKGGVWHLRQKKTDSVNRVPLLPQALMILERYKEDTYPLPVPSNQKMNEYLKELCRLVKLEEPTTVTLKQGGKRVEQTVPKHELVSTHTGRRTFITLSLEKGMRAEVVMRITGHRDYQSFKKYIKITDKVKEQEMERIWAAPKPNPQPESNKLAEVEQELLPQPQPEAMLEPQE